MTARENPTPSHRMPLTHILDELENEKAAIASVRLAHDAVADAALICHHAKLDGQAVKDALREASQALLRLVKIIEGAL